MFDNIGGKIKALAKVVCWIGIILSVIAGFVLIAGGEYILEGMLTAGLGGLLSWISSFVLYGFGQLVENSDIVAERSEKDNDEIE